MIRFFQVTLSVSEGSGSLPWSPSLTLRVTISSLIFKSRLNQQAAHASRLTRAESQRRRGNQKAAKERVELTEAMQS